MLCAERLGCACLAQPEFLLKGGIYPSRWYLSWAHFGPYISGGKKGEERAGERSRGHTEQAGIKEEMKLT